MTTTKIVCTAIYVLFIAATLITVGVGQYINLNSLIVVIVIGALFTAAAKGGESFIQKFGNGSVRAGLLGSIIGIIAVFGSDGFASADMSKIGMALAVVSLTVYSTATL